MAFRDDIKNKIMVFDGSMGRMLHKNGLGVGVCPEEWNITHPEIIKSIYQEYVDSGSDVIQTNTFQSNLMKLYEYGLEEKHYEINYQSAKLAKEVAIGKCYVAASIGPLGKLLEPFGELTFEQAYDTFKEQVIAVADGGADIISFETFTDVSELRIALLAAKENCSLPVICSLSYEQNCRTLMGSEPHTCAVILNAMGADLIGTNCSFGAEYMLKIAEAYCKIGLPFSIKPNAGLPEIVDGKQVFKETAQSFAKFVPDFLKNGAILLGGCCGTTPEYISEVAKVVKGEGVARVAKVMPDVDYITSATNKLALCELKTAEIGIMDASKDEVLKNDLINGDLGAVTDAAMDLLDEDFEAILINIDIDDQSDEQLLAKVVKEVQVYLKHPLILKSNNGNMLDAALRIYKGRAGIIINDAAKATELAKKYGAVDCRELISNEE